MGKINVVIYHPNSKVCAESKAPILKKNVLCQNESEM